MQKQYPDDVVAISLNLDHDSGDEPADDLQADVRGKLTELKMTTTNVMSSTVFDEVLEHFDLFSLPAAVIFDRDGSRLKTLEGDLSYEKQIFPLVEELTGDAEAGEADAKAEVSVEIRTWDEFEKWVATQQGKPVVVDVWSNFCEPCIKEFPEFVSLHRQQGDDVVCASLNLDYYGAGDTPEELQPRVLEFLRKHNASTVNFLSSTPDETVLDAIEVAALPVSLVYSSSGELEKVFSNAGGENGPEGFSYQDDVTPVVERLLSQGDNSSVDEDAIR